MGWAWSDLDEVLDNWLASNPAGEDQRAVLRALAELMEHADLIEGDPVLGERELVRRVPAGAFEIVFLRAEPFRVLRLLAIRPRLLG